jgi:hypothetical protein
MRADPMERGARQRALRTVTDDETVLALPA